MLPRIIFILMLLKMAVLISISRKNDDTLLTKSPIPFDQFKSCLLPGGSL